MPKTPLCPLTQAVADIRPELPPETCKRIALAVLFAGTTIGLGEGKDLHIHFNEASVALLQPALEGRSRPQ